MPINVLVLEDNAADARLIQEALKEAGNDRFEIDCTPRLEAALEKLKNRNPDVIVLDLSLPDSDGLATFTQVHLRAPDVPIVVMTGLKDEEIGFQAMRAGAQDFLVKGQSHDEWLARSILYAIERWRIRTALQRSEDRYRALVEATSQVVWSTNPRGELEEDSPRWRAFTGQTEEELKGWGWTEAIHPEDRPKAIKAMIRAIETRSHCQSVFRARRKDGGYRYFQNHVVPILERDGSVREWVGTSTDVTEIQKAEEQIRELSGRLLQAQDDERRRIALELHDSTGQSLTGILAHLTRVQKLMRGDDAARQSLKSAMAATKACMEEISNISHLLHPPELDSWGLRAALCWFVSQFQRRTSIAVELEMAQELDRLPKEIETAVYRIVQEGLNNVYRHSGSPRAQITLAFDSEALILKIADQGRGIRAVSSAERSHGARDGLGIPGMRERVKQLLGECEINSGNQGTEISVRLPCPRAANSA